MQAATHWSVSEMRMGLLPMRVMRLLLIAHKTRQKQNQSEGDALSNTRTSRLLFRETIGWY